MPNYSDSSVDDADVFGDHATSKRAATRKKMKSLFGEGATNAKKDATLSQHEQPGDAKKNLSLLITGGTDLQNASSPLQTAVHAIVLAYKGEAHFGTCVVALCVPHTTAAISVPLIAIVDREKRLHCRVRVDRSLQLLQNTSAPQYASLYDPTFGGHWSLMFKGRRECIEFVASVHTTITFAEVTEGGPTKPFIEWGVEEKREDGVSQMPVSTGDAVYVSFAVWLLRRVPNTRFFSLGNKIEEVPPEAPREIKVGQGTLMIGVEEALVGMCSGASRLVFLSPRQANISKKNAGHCGLSSSDNIVVHITCHEVVCSSMIENSNRQSTPCLAGDHMFSSGAQVPSSFLQAQPLSAQQSTMPAVGGGDINVLLQTLLFQTLQQHQNNSVLGGCGVGKENGELWAFLERSIDRLHVQLSSLYEKIDRLAFTEAIEKNNLAIEKIIKKAVGKAPINDVDVEDMAKDRDSLLATVERLKQRLEEESANYHRALEAIGRHKDELHCMENNLRIEQSTHASRVREMEEQRRLQLVEMDMRHREALERLAEEKFREGHAAGLREGVAAGKQDALEAVGSHSEREWRERLFASEQRVVQLESEMQEAAARHIAERRQMQEQINALEEMTEMLEKRAQRAAATSQFGGADSTSQRCKLLRRAMNATYTNIETQLYAVGERSVEVEDVLRMVLFAIKSEIRTFTDEIKKEAVLLWESQALGDEVAEARAAELRSHHDNTMDEGTAAVEEVTTAMVRKMEENSNEEATGQLDDHFLLDIDSLPPVPPAPKLHEESLQVCEGTSKVFLEPPLLLTPEEDVEVEDKNEEDKDGSQSNITSESCNTGKKLAMRIPKAVSPDDSDW